MHDLIQDMGKDIVNVQKKPGKRSRLWLTKDIEEVMMNNTGTDMIEAIRIMTPSKLQISEKALEHMDELRMLLLEDECEEAVSEDADADSENEDAESEEAVSESEEAVSESEDAESEEAVSESEDVPANNEDDVRISFHDDTFKYLSNNLSCFVWKNYRGESLPPNFEPKGLVHLKLEFSSLRHLWNGRKNLTYLRYLDLSCSGRLIEAPDFSGMPNLEYLYLLECGNLKEVHPSLGNCTKLIRLDLCMCESLKRFPCVNVESLEYLQLGGCYSLEKFPEIIGSMKSELEIDMGGCGIRELPSSIFQYPTHMTELDLSWLENIVTLPNSIGKLKSLVILTLWCCRKLESLPEEIGDLENLEKLYAYDTLISRPPSSIIRLNKLKILSFDKEQVLEGHFVFPRVNQGLRSLEELNLANCNLIDGGLPEDIGCLSSLKRLYLKATNCDPLPRSIAQLCALQVLDVSFCKRLRELPELPPNVEELKADCCVGPSIQNYQNVELLIFTEVEFDDSIGDLFAQTLLKCILSLRKAYSASDSLPQRVFKMWHPATQIPDWFKYHNQRKDLLVKLPENWYANGKFLGFAICYYGDSEGSVVELITSSNDDESQKLSKRLAIPPLRYTLDGISFYFIPLASLWDTSKANGKTPNAYRHLMFSQFWRSAHEFGFRLLYKDDELEHNHNHKRKFGEHYDSMTNDVSCSFSKKQMSHSNIRGSSIFENLPQQEEGPSTSGFLQLFPENPGS